MLHNPLVAHPAPRLLPFTCVALSLLLATLLVLQHAPHTWPAFLTTSTPATTAIPPNAITRSRQLPPALQLALSCDIGHNDPGYQLTAASAGYQLTNPAQ
jgi:hypothetical protein